MSREESLDRIARRISALGLQIDDFADLRDFVKRKATGETRGTSELPNIQAFDLPFVVGAFKSALLEIKADKRIDPGGILRAADMMVGDQTFARQPFVRAFARMVAKSERYSESFRLLAEEFGSEQKTFGDQYRESISDPVAIEQLYRLLAESLVGSYRVLFPVVDKDSAQQKDDKSKDLSATLLAAKITVTRRGELDEFISKHLDLATQRRVFVVPWSVFQANDDDKRSFSIFCENLPSLIDNKEDKYEYWIEFQSLRHDDFDENNLDVLNLSVDDIVRAFAPKVFEFQGNSMGLAIGIGAWAASQQLCVNLAIATGHLQSGQTIGRIDSLRPKLVACSDFHYVSKHKWLTLISEENAKSEPYTSSLRGLDIVPHKYERFNDVKEDAKSILTDGFDTVRNALRNAVANGKSPVPAGSPAQIGNDDELPAMKGNAVKSVFESARNVDEWVAGYCRADVEAADRLYNDLVASLSAHRVTGSGFHDDASNVNHAPDCLQFFSVPFNEQPSTVANWLVTKLCQELWPAATPDNVEERARWTSLSVVLPVSIQTLAGESDVSTEVNDESLDRLCKAVKQGVTEFCMAAGSEANPSIEAEALRIACGRSGKLLLIAYEAPSLEVSFGDENKMSHRLAALRLLREVAETASESHSKGQPAAARHSIVVIVPDEHYKRWAEHKCQACSHS